jgi:hypothetical protein
VVGFFPSLVSGDEWILLLEKSDDVDEGPSDVQLDGRFDWNDATVDRDSRSCKVFDQIFATKLGN